MRSQDTWEFMNSINEKIFKINQKQNFIFDLDGTLADSMWVWDNLLIDFLAEYGYTASDELLDEVAYMSMEQSSARVCELFDLPMSPEGIINRWTDMIYDSYAHKIRLKSGAAEYLEYLKENGKSLALATASSRELAEACLKNNGVLEFFDVLTYADEVGEGKSSPKIYRETLRRLNASAADSVLFEDILVGLKTASGIGLDVVIVEDKAAREDKAQLMEQAYLYIKDFYGLGFRA